MLKLKTYKYLSLREFMSFLENLEDVTGTEEQDGIVTLIGREIPEKPRFLNSGRMRLARLDENEFGYQPLFDLRSDNPNHLFRPDEKFNPALLRMPRNYINQKPHCHKGGEFAYVIDGEYFDADMEGSPLVVYPSGSIVFYPRFSTHRPESREGALLFYIPFDGITFGENPEDLARKMVRLGTTEEALEFALMWMVPSEVERQRIMDSLPLPKS